MRAARSLPSTTVPCEFRVHFNTRLGQDLWLVGSTPALGEWSVANACPLRWTAGGVWTTTVQLPAGAIAFFKLFLKEDGYLKEWQGGNNIMLVVPQSASELPGGMLVAESTWTGAPTSSSLASEARVVQRMHAAEAIVGTAEAAARAAGQVAQVVMGELITAREEAALAVRFIKDKGMQQEFERITGGEAARRDAAQANGFYAAPAKAPRAAKRSALSDAEIDAEINQTLAAQLSGELDLSQGGGTATQGRVDLSASDAWETPARTSASTAAPPRPLILNNNNTSAR